MIGKPPSNRPYHGSNFVLGCLGVVLKHPELGDGVFAADQLVEVVGGGIVGVQLLETVVSVDVFAALILRLGQVILGGLAPGGALAVLGDLGECFFGLRELALLERASWPPPIRRRPWDPWAPWRSAASRRSPGSGSMNAEPSVLPIGLRRGVIQRSNRFCVSTDALASAISSLEIGPDQTAVVGRPPL